MTNSFPTAFRRRTFLTTTALAAAALATPAWAQRPKPGTNAGTVFQVVDMSAAQIDISKDFLIGSRAAWQELNARGGVNGKPMRHVVVEVDGSVASLQSAIATLNTLPDCLAVVGTAGNLVAGQMASWMAREAPDLAHVAPWLNNAPLDTQTNTFGIFATRREQITHAIKSLSVMGVTELGAVFASPDEQARNQNDMEQTAASLKLRLRSYVANQGLPALAASLRPDTPRILIFLGGTPELAQFAQGIEKQAVQRYIVAMSDVNIQALQQLGVSRYTPVIATQAVPLVNGNQPVVRAFRETLGRLYDEPPTPQSLAGYLSARYAQDALLTLEGPLTRANVLQSFARRVPVDVGGFRVNPAMRRSASAYVTQSMMAADGRLVG
jgi:ABC-type branched-subunit amino acid transport system substrate-binding protein